MGTILEGDVMKMLWMCNKCGYIFRWVRRGDRTTPEGCPICGGSDIDSLEW